MLFIELIADVFLVVSILFVNIFFNNCQQIREIWNSFDQTLLNVFKELPVAFLLTGFTSNQVAIVIEQSHQILLLDLPLPISLDISYTNPTKS